MRTDWQARFIRQRRLHDLFASLTELPRMRAPSDRNVIYDLLFRAAWKTLKEVIADEQLFEAAAVMMLHTWNL